MLVTSAATQGSYSADDMTVLEGLDAVRKRPGMYIGSTDSRGINHLVNEIIDNSVDEAVAGHADKISVTLHPDGSVEVADNGRGIPTGINAKTGISGVELALTRLHGGGKFSSKNYNSSGGLHGVGSTAVNALSHRMDAVVKQMGKVHEVNFRYGVAGTYAGPGPDAKFTPAVGLRTTGKCAKTTTGTTIRYWPDLGFFDPGSALDVDSLRSKLRNTAFLAANLTVELHDNRPEGTGTETFQFANGVRDMVDYLTPTSDKPLCDTLCITGAGSYRETATDENGRRQENVLREMQVEIVFRWGTGYDTTVECFTNTIRNQHGGHHRKGFEAGAYRALMDAIKGTRGLLKPKEDLPSRDDMLEGMTAVIHVRAPEPKFTSQTKDELSTAGVARVVTQVVEKHLKEWAENRKTKTEARVILGKIVDASRVRLTQKEQKDAARRKTALEGASMPAKLVDCRAVGVDRSEIFIVEGDSAKGSAKDARVSDYQALLPIRGKILNVQKASMSQVLANAECAAIIQAIGAGSGRTFDVEAMRYGRVIIMADADVDGSHIRTLLICLFMRFMRPMIEAGRLYAAMPPLHRIVTKGRSSETFLTFTQAEMESKVAALEAAGASIQRPIKRFKGLGEMNAADLWDTTMDPSRRAIRRITIADAQAAEALMVLLMGEEVPPRKEWIVSRAATVDREFIDA